MSQDNLQQLLHDCVQIRGLLLRMQQSPKVTLSHGTKEADAIRGALDIMDKRLLDGYHKSKSLGGKTHKAEITANSAAVSKMRGKTRRHTQTLIESYLAVREKETVAE